MATAATTPQQQGQGTSGQSTQQAGSPSAQQPAQTQAEIPPPRRITDFASI